jgi:hypothetical protein
MNALSLSVIRLRRTRFEIECEEIYTPHSCSRGAQAFTLILLPLLTEDAAILGFL